MKFVLRMVTEAAPARAVAERVCAQLDGASLHAIEPASDARLVEIVLHVEAARVEDVTGAIGSGWDPQPDGGAILIHRERAWFMEDAVRWARVEVLR